MEQLTHSDTIRKNLREFISEKITPNIALWEAQGDLPIHDLVKGLYEIGCFGFRFPVEDGGQGLGVSAHLAFAEEIGGIPSGGVSMALTIHGDMVLPLLDEGMTSPECRARYLQPALRGELIYSHAISEKGAGSDPSAISTTAHKVAGGYLVTGVKHCISLATMADMHCLLARIDGLRFPFNMVLLLVDNTAEGVCVKPSGKMMGNHSCPVGNVHLDNVFVPNAARIGNEGMGFVIQMRQFVEERVISAARGVSASANLIGATIAHCSERKVFGASLLELQTVSHRLVDLKSEVKALRTMISETVESWERNENFETASCVIKLLSNRLARKSGRECMKLQGASGYLSGTDVERFYRDGRLYAISTGSDEAMQIAIARLLGTHLENVLPPVSNTLVELSFDEIVGKDFRVTLSNLGQKGYLQPCLGDDGFDQTHKLIESLANNLPTPYTTSLVTHLDVASLLKHHGSTTLRDDYLHKLGEGTASYALAITEQEAGSDFGQLSTAATLLEDGTWELNGAKAYITNGAIADGYMVLACTPGNNPLMRYTIFAVPRDSTVATEAMASMGNSGCLGRVSFTKTRLRQEHVIGQVGQGSLIVQQHLVKERYFISLHCYALAKASLQRTVQEMERRNTFGSALSTRQALQFRFADALSDLMLLRSVLGKLATELKQGNGVSLDDTASAKLRATSLLERVSDFELQMAAAEGYQNNHAASCLYRDGIGLSIAGGSDGVLKDIQAKKIGFDL